MSSVLTAQEEGVAKTATSPPVALSPLAMDRPVAELPPGIVGTAGKVTLVADFAHAVPGAEMQVYLINLTQKALELNRQDWDPYMKLQTPNEKGVWVRCQTHEFSWCGNSYFRAPLGVGQFWRLTHRQQTGRAAQVRYKLYLQEGEEIVSNAGPGVVDPVEEKLAAADRFQLHAGDFQFLRQVALSEIILDHPEDGFASMQNEAILMMVRTGKDPKQVDETLAEVANKVPRQAENVRRLRDNLATSLRLREEQEAKWAQLAFGPPRPEPAPVASVAAPPPKSRDPFAQPEALERIHLPVSKLPKRIKGVPGKAALVVDYDAIGQDGKVPLYLINLTERRLTFGEPYETRLPLLQETRNAAGEWVRSQWLRRPKWEMYHTSRDGEKRGVEPQHFVRLQALQPVSGRSAEVRYRYFDREAEHDLVSNVGSGLVDPEEITLAAQDELAVARGSFEFLRQVALGEIHLTTPDLEAETQQEAALMGLLRQGFDLEKAEPIVRQVAENFPEYQDWVRRFHMMKKSALEEARRQREAQAEMRLMREAEEKRRKEQAGARKGLSPITPSMIDALR